MKPFPLLVLGGYLVAFGVVLTPPLAFGVLATCSSSPIFMTYHIVGPDAVARADLLSLLLLVSCEFVEWIFLTLAFWFLLAIQACILEILTCFTILLRKCR